VRRVVAEGQSVRLPTWERSVVMGASVVHCPVAGSNFSSEASLFHPSKPPFTSGHGGCVCVQEHEAHWAGRQGVQAHAGKRPVNVSAVGSRDWFGRVQPRLSEF